jgi:hypothetical protein
VVSEITAQYFITGFCLLGNKKQLQVARSLGLWMRKANLSWQSHQTEDCPHSVKTEHPILAGVKSYKLFKIFAYILKS